MEGGHRLGSDLKHIQVCYVLDDLGKVALYFGPGIAKQGEGGPAAAPSTAVARLVFWNRHAHSPCHSTLQCTSV